VFKNGPLSACWRIVVVFVGMGCWTIRSLLVPVLAGYGTVGAMLNSSNGQDIVLNSVAIGFVLELDEFLYDNVLSKRAQQSYQETTLPSTSPLSVRGGSKVATTYAYLIYVLDIVLLLHAFFEEIYDASALDLTTMVEVDIKRRYDRIRLHLLLRAALLALTHGQLAMLSAKSRRWSRVRLAGPVLLFMVLVVAFAAMMYTVMIAGFLDSRLGCNFPIIMLSPRTMTCCMQREFFIQGAATLGFDVEECEKLDEVPGIFDLIVEESRYNNNDEHHSTMRYAWADYPPEGYYFQQTMGNFMQLTGMTVP